MDNAAAFGADGELCDGEFAVVGDKANVAGGGEAFAADRDSDRKKLSPCPLESKRKCKSKVVPKHRFQVCVNEFKN